MRKAVMNFGKSNKILSVIGIMAVFYIAFYWFTYDMPEIFHNAHILVEIGFQLSLALIANLFFYIFQVYAPLQKRKAEMRSIIKGKVETICSLIESPLSDIAQMYIGDRKEIENFTSVEMRKILENYNCDDYVLSWRIGNEEKHYSFGENIRNNFEGIEQAIDDLLAVYSPYLDDAEKDVLVQLKADHFYELLILPFYALTGVTRVINEKQIDEFRSFQQKYIKAKGIFR